MFSFLAQGSQEVKVLNLKCTGLTKEDLQHISTMTQSNKLPNLRVLNLSQNIFTGCLSFLLPDPHQGLLELEELHLRDTELNKDDLQHLSNITQSNKLPKLLIMDLSNNALTGCLSSFLPYFQQILPNLEELHLCSTALNEEDLQHLAHLIETHKLPRLTLLNIGKNKLNEFEMDVKKLVEACVTHHQRELRLWLWFNNLSHAYKEKLKHHCQGTIIELWFSSFFHQR